jgi:hypothetical protein
MKRIKLEDAKEALKLTDESIARWEMKLELIEKHYDASLCARGAAVYTKKSERLVGFGYTECPLCMKYYFIETVKDPYCGNCPIAIYGRTHSCQKTPYVKVLAALSKGKITSRLTKAVKAEIVFLKKIRAKIVQNNPEVKQKSRDARH